MFTRIYQFTMSCFYCLGYSYLGRRLDSQVTRSCRISRDRLYSSKVLVSDEPEHGPISILWGRCRRGSGVCKRTCRSACSLKTTTVVDPKEISVDAGGGESSFWTPFDRHQCDLFLEGLLWSHLEIYNPFHLSFFNKSITLLEQDVPLVLGLIHKYRRQGSYCTHSFPSSLSPTSNWKICWK